MKKLLFIKDSTENKISYYHLLFFMLALPFDRFYSTIVLISFIVHTAIFFRKEQWSGAGIKILALQSVFLVTLFSILYASFTLRGLDIAGKQLAILLFPLLFLISPLDIAKYRDRLLLTFAFGCTLTILYLFYNAFYIIGYNHLPLKVLFSSAFVNRNFSMPIEMHPTYLSMMLVICITFLLQQLFTGDKKKEQLLYATCCFVLVAGLIQLGSKSVLFAFIIIINAGFPFFLLQQKARKKFLLISVPFFALLLVLILSVDVFKNRYMLMLKDDLSEHTGSASGNGRIERWNVAVDLIKKSPLAGTGSGSEIPLLRELYFERKMYSAYLDSLNAHNQYLSFLITSGIIGLFVYLGTLCWGFWLAAKAHDILLLSFMILVTIVSFAEDLLDVNKGIFFYAFFFSFLVWQKEKKGIHKLLRQPLA